GTPAHGQARALEVHATKHRARRLPGVEHVLRHPEQALGEQEELGPLQGDAARPIADAERATDEERVEIGALHDGAAAPAIVLSDAEGAAGAQTDAADGLRLDAVLDQAAFEALGTGERRR